MKIGFIGAGKAGNSLSRYLHSPRIEISGFYSKTFEHSRQAADYTKSVAFLTLEDVVSSSDVIFVTTPDGVIRQVWETIKALEDQGRVRLAGKKFCHVSGSLSSTVFEDIAPRGAFGCSVHPMQAISSKNTDLEGTFFTADGDEKAVSLVKEMLEGKGNTVTVIDPSCKKKYHMAASTASNLVAGLVQMAIDSLSECGFESDTARKMLTPLMLGNINNICSKGTTEALTGPVERCDCDTVRSHLNQLSGEKQEIYRLLSTQLIEIAQRKNKARDYSSLRKILEEKDQ